MKINILIAILLVFSVSTIAQSKLEVDAKEFFWGANDQYANVTEIPEKWKNESAVIIYKNVNYDYHKFGKNVTYKNSVRKRIKLLDKVAVEEFSEFSFEKRFVSTKGRITYSKAAENIVGVKIIKADGKEIEIDVNEIAVVVDGETKIAIPNLEVGDIIDYYFYQIEPFKSKTEVGFDPVETTLSEEYPIIDFRLFFETENDFFINFNSFNGAPGLEQLPNDSKSLRQYELVANNIEKSEYIRWYYPLVEEPSYKFQVFFARSGKFEDRATAFLPENESEIKKSVSKDEILDLYDSRFQPTGKLGDVISFFRNHTFDTDADKVEAVYYYMRHYYLTRFIESFYVDQADLMFNPYVYYGDPVFIQNDKQFVTHFTAFLKRNDIDYDIVIAKRRYDGNIDKLLIEKNVYVLIKVNTDPVIYAEFFGPYTSINEYSPLIEGTDVYLLSSSKKTKIDQIEKDKIPNSTHRNNIAKKVVNISLNDSFTGVSIMQQSSYIGHQKGGQQLDRLLFYDYVYEDYAKYKTKSFIEKVKRKKDKEKVGPELNALIEKLKDNQKKKFEELAKNDFEFEAVEDYSFEINETGRFGLDSAFIYTENFNVENVLVKKAGPNYIFEIGKLIGGQYNPEEKFRKRKGNIHRNYPISYDYEIRFKFPEGYTVTGIDKLNKHIDNNTGAFISTAEIIANELIIKTSKQYKHNYESNSNWESMLEFIDEAYEFTNQKILLKKI